MPLPEALKIDIPLDSKPREIDSARTLTLTVSPKGYPILEGVYLLTPAKLINILKETPHSFCACQQGEFDSLLKGATKQQLVELELTGKLVVDKATLYYYHGALRVREGLKNYYLWNVAPFIRSDFPTKSITEVGATFLFELRRAGVPYYTFSTPASLSRRIFETYPEVREELWDAHFIPLSILALFYDHAYGPRMESSGIGTLSLFHYDKAKSHLNLLRDCPSISRAKKVVGTTKHDSAAYGIYRITAFIPNTYNFNPLPVKDKDSKRLYYPSGKVTGWYPKPYLDLLEELRIPYRVHNSIEFFAADDTKPYWNWATEIDRYLVYSSPFLDLKGLYCALVGSARSIYTKINLKTGELQERARSTFHPILYSHIMAMQNVDIWREAERNSAIAIRVDAISTLKPITTPRFGLEFKLKGNTTFLTPHYKSYPGFVYWREMIEAYPDSPSVTLAYDFRLPLHLVGHDPRDLGRLITTTRTIPPSYGNRTGSPIKQVGDLLSNWFPSEVSNIPPEDNINERYLEYRLAQGLEIH